MIELDAHGRTCLKPSSRTYSTFSFRACSTTLSTALPLGNECWLKSLADVADRPLDWMCPRLRAHLDTGSGASIKVA
jgi:hypothetical protein